VLVTQACNPSYSGGRDQEDLNSKPAQINRLRNLIWIKTLHKNRTGGVAQGEGPEFKPQYHKKKKKVFPASAWSHYTFSILFIAFLCPWAVISMEEGAEIAPHMENQCV
jgi:hypothetical protein